MTRAVASAGREPALGVHRLDLVRRRVTVATGFVSIDGQLVEGTPKTYRCCEVPVPRFDAYAGLFNADLDDVAARLDEAASQAACVSSLCPESGPDGSDETAGRRG
jgi:hypothetical protein